MLVSIYFYFPWACFLIYGVDLQFVLGVCEKGEWTHKKNVCKSFTRPDGSTKYNAEPDFKFVVIERFLSAENEFSLRDGILLNA